MNFNTSLQFIPQELLDALELNAANILTCQEEFLELSKKKINNINKLDSQFLQRFKKHNDLALEAKKSALESLNQLEEEIKKNNNIYKLENYLAKISQEVEQATIQNKNKYLKLKNEYTGKITIVEKEASLNAKEASDRQAENERQSRAKFFELEKKTISEIDAIEEELLIPVSNKRKLDIDSILSGKETTEEVDEAKVKSIRNDGILKLEQLSLNFLDSKKNFEIDQYSSSTSTKTNISVLELESKIEIVNLRKVLEKIEADFNKENIFIKYLEDERIVDVKEQLLMHNAASRIKYNKKKYKLDLASVRPYHGYEKDKIKLLNTLKDSDLEILAEARKICESFLEEVLVLKDYEESVNVSDLYSLLVLSYTNRTYHINAFLKNLLPSLLVLNYSSTQIDGFDLSEYTSNMQREILCFYDKHYKLLNKILEKDVKKKVNTLDELNIVIDNYIKQESELLAKLFDNLNDTITRIYNYGLSIVEKMNGEYVCLKESEEKKVTEEYLKNKENITANLDKEKEDLYKGILEVRLVRNKELNDNTDIYNQHIRELDNEIVGYEMDILSLNKKMNVELLAFIYKKENYYAKKQIDVKKDALERLKRI